MNDEVFILILKVFVVISLMIILGLMATVLIGVIQIVF